MNRQVRTTVVFGFGGAILLFPIASFIGDVLGVFEALELTLWLILSVYAVLLVRWSKTPLLPIVFPLAILLVAALVWPWRAGFYWLFLLTLSWIRSGICFKAPALRLLMAEAVSMAGGALLVAVWYPASPVAMCLSLWLFFLIQSLYFFILPGDRVLVAGDDPRDAFDVAFQEAEKIVG